MLLFCCHDNRPIWAFTMSDLPAAVEENLRLLCAEVEGQLSYFQAYFEQPDAATAQRVILRAGYSYNPVSYTHLRAHETRR